MIDEKEQKSTELIFRSWGHNISNKTLTIRDLVDLIKHDLSNESPNLDRINKRLDMIAIISSEISDVPLPYKIEKISVNLLIQELVKKLQLFNRYKDVKFSMVLDGEPYVVANSAWLAEVFEELFRNAIDAMNNLENKKIEITSQISEDKVTFFINDNGKGIEREQLSNILKDPPIIRTDGTGRGLYIVRLTVELYDGYIKVNTSSNGTTVAICLPIYDKTGRSKL